MSVVSLNSPMAKLLDFGSASEGTSSVYYKGGTEMYLFPKI